jgi:diacylglycerol kinase (ATP)
MRIPVPAQRKAIVIYSPHSGRSMQREEALAYLQQAGVEIQRVISIADMDHLPPQGEIWKQQGVDIAVAAGGDGLIGGVIAHSVESGLPLGIMPLGTSNDTARSLHIPEHLQQAAEVIAQGHVHEVDVGMAQPAEQAPLPLSTAREAPAPALISPRQHSYFAHVLTVGVNVAFARVATNVATRQRFGKLTYPFAALEVLKNYQPMDVTLHFEGLKLIAKPDTTLSTEEIAALSTLQCRVLQVTVVNAPIFGGSWQLAVPDASLEDRLLDIVVFEDIDLGKLNNAIARFFNRRENGSEQPESLWHERHPSLNPAELTGIPGIHHVQAHAVEITTTLDPRDATLDGEVRGQTPLYTSIARQRLKVLAPD